VAIAQVISDDQLFNNNSDLMAHYVDMLGHFENRPDVVFFPEDLSVISSYEQVERRIAQIKRAAMRNSIAVGFGYAFDEGRDVRYMIISAEGNELARFTKYNLVNRIVEINGSKLAVLICAESLVIEDSDNAMRYAQISAEEMGVGEFLSAANSADAIVVPANMLMLRSSEEILDKVNQKTGKPVIFVNVLKDSDRGESGVKLISGENVVLDSSEKAILVTDINSVVKLANARIGVYHGQTGRHQVPSFRYRQGRSYLRFRKGFEQQDLQLRY
jgi:predicted amidohydrolase